MLFIIDNSSFFFFFLKRHNAYLKHQKKCTKTSELSRSINNLFCRIEQGEEEEEEEDEGEEEKEKVAEQKRLARKKTNS